MRNVPRKSILIIIIIMNNERIFKVDKTLQLLKAAINVRGEGETLPKF